MATTKFSRRTLLATALAAAACRPKPKYHDGKLHLRFSTWGSQTEIDVFRSIIARYQARQTDVAINLEEISYRTQSSIDVELAAGVGPDLFRVEYQNVGRYSPSGAAIPLSKYLPPNYGDAFTAPVWTAVQYHGTPHAFPHHTDTSVILYNKNVFKRLGLKVPQTLDESWTWQEFIDVSLSLKRVCDYAFAMNWTYGGSFRWLNFLHQHNGRLLEDDFRTAAVPSQAAIETLRWTQSFFTKALVPSSDSATSTEQVENLFATGVVGMYFDIGPEYLRDTGTKVDWGATFLPQDVRRCSELGGNAIAVTRDCKHPDAAVDFALFLTNEENMREFVISAQFLPVRRSLLRENLRYSFKPDEMRVHLEQSTTVPVELARTVTLPKFPAIERALGDELDRAFTDGQTAEATLERVARSIRRELEST